MHRAAPPYFAKSLNHQITKSIMSLTPSTMLPLGTEAPAFALPNPADDGATVEKPAPGDKPLLVMFVCNHCPYVVHVADELGRLAADYGGEGGRVDVVAINSNDVDGYPDDAPDRMPGFAEAHGWTFPYLFDASQDVAKAYSAACTPDFFLFDRDHRLAYRGQLDGTRPRRISSGNYDNADGAANGEDLRTALDGVLATGVAPNLQKPSMGCNIKWK